MTTWNAFAAIAVPLIININSSLVFLLHLHGTLGSLGALEEKVEILVVLMCKASYNA